MTENEEICQQLNAKRFIDLTNKMLQQTSLNKYSADHIHELALKSIINMSKNATETFEEADLKASSSTSAACMEASRICRSSMRCA